MLTEIIVISILVVSCFGGCALWLWWYTLEKVKKEKKEIQVQSDAVETQRDTFKTQLDTANAEKDELQVQLNAVEIQRDTFKTQLDTAEIEKKGALWLLYLSEVSLLASVSVLYSERRRCTNLEHNSKKTLKSYQEFHKNVKARAETRLIRKGAAVAMSFIPGLGLLDILGDIGEILSEADDASGFIGEMSGTLKTLTTGSTGIAIGFAQPTIDDDLPADLITDVHRTFKESFEEEFKENISAYDSDELLDASKLKDFVTNTIQSMEDLGTVKPMSEKERQMIIERILERVNEFIDAVGDYNQINKEQPKGNTAEPKSD